MLVVDMFSGLNGWGDPWRERGHTVVSADINSTFGADYQLSLMNPDTFINWLDAKGYGNPDVILASPPCTAFTVMRIGHNWTKDHQPKNDTARTGLSLVYSTVEIIERLKPRFWVIENPVGKLRKLPVVAEFERRTVTYCQYGEKRMKPTDLWGGFPDIELRPMCKQGAPCHIASPRGSFTGTQGLASERNRNGIYDKTGPAEAAKVPYQLSRDICIAAENHLARLV